MSGRLYVGTSGFAYPDWAPAFYPAGARGEALLPFYAARLPACELNNTFYRHPSARLIGGWLAATPPDFRFAVKAQRGSIRALRDDPAGTVSWLAAPYRLFGERLGSVLYRVPTEVQRDDQRLAALLEAWPAELPLTVELQHPSWLDDRVLQALRAAGVALCATELETDAEPPRLFRTGPFMYLRLRRDDYSPAELDAWAERLDPFLESGADVYVFFKHDAVGRAPALALELAQRVASIVGP
ncbi:MAG: DUF72 domain-containing protein [Chloroflexi bacterium]|nr:DUF72 domain-containing protein [Chloroflexota bacterium]